MNYKVKYNKQKYRNEYLKSEEWLNLRSVILKPQPSCQCCGKKASDVHHLVYRNIVDVKITDLLPVCRKCHTLIHEAINDGYISQDPNDLHCIKQLTLNILKDQKYVEFRKWLNHKHKLDEEEVDLIRTLQPFVIKKISGIVKKNIWYDNISTYKFSGRQILKIRKIIKTSLYRRKVELDLYSKKKLTGRRIRGIMDDNKYFKSIKNI